MHVLELRPERRINLYDLEHAVRGMDTFFMNKEDLASPRFRIAGKQDEKYRRRRQEYLARKDLLDLPSHPWCEESPVEGRPAHEEARVLPEKTPERGVGQDQQQEQKREREPLPPPLPPRPQRAAACIMAIARKHIQARFTTTTDADADKLSLDNHKNNHNSQKKERPPPLTLPTSRKGWYNREKTLPLPPILASSTWSSEVDTTGPKTPTVQECGMGEPRIAAERRPELAHGVLGDVDGGDTAAASARVVLMTVGAVPAESADSAGRGDVMTVKPPPQAYYTRGKTRMTKTRMRYCRRLGVLDADGGTDRGWITASNLLARV
jgi:hypothetical protein